MLWSNSWIMEMDSIRGSWGVKKTKYNYWTITHMLGYGAGRTSVNYTHLVHWNCSPKW